MRHGGLVGQYNFENVNPGSFAAVGRLANCFHDTVSLPVSDRQRRNQA